MNEGQCLRGRVSLRARQFVLSVRGDVVVVGDAVPCDVRHAELLALVDEGRAAQGEQHRGECLRSEDGVGVLREEVVHRARAVVVLKVDRAPALAGDPRLTCGERRLELCQLPRLHFAPCLAAFIGDEDMGKLKEHGEHAVFADPVGELCGADAVRLTDGEDVVPVKDLAAELMEEVQDAGRIDRHRVDAYHAVCRIGRAVGEDGGFLDVGDRIDAESADALVEPEVRGTVEGVAYLRVLPVEIGLRLGKGVQVVLPALGAVCPRRAAEDAAPVRRRTAVLLRVAPDVPVTLFVGAAGARLQEPRMLVGAVVVDEIHDDADAALLCACDQLLHLVHRAKIVIDVRVVADVVAVVDHGRRVNGGEPDRADTELLQIVELFRDAAQVARTAARRVVETLRVDLVDGGVLPPFVLVHRRPFPFPIFPIIETLC